MKGAELNKKYTYAQMCEIFECEQKTSTNSRNSQLKEWEAICKIDRPCKGKYVILEIYSEPKEVDNQKGRKPKCYEQFKVSRKNWFKSGVYKIQFENKVYIGSTKSFRDRYITHITTDKEKYPHVWELLKEEKCTFEVIELIENKEMLNVREQYYIDLYSTMKLDVINKRKAYFDKKKKKKKKTKKIKIVINEEDYERVIKLLKDSGIKYS